MASYQLNEKASFDIDSQDEKNMTSVHVANDVFDTPKTSLSRSTTDENHTVQPPTVPAPTKGFLQVNTKPTNTDLEKGHLTTVESHTSPLYEPSREYSVANTYQECSMWPSKQTLKHQAQEQKCRRRAGNFFGLSQRWGGMSKKQRLGIRILLVLLAISVAVGVAIGISRAVGGGVWAGQNKTKAIDGSK